MGALKPLPLDDGYVGHQISRQRYRVVAPDGSEVAIVAGINSAVSQAERHRRKAQERKRTCLCCPAVFTSTGPGHRMCVRCRDRSRGLI